MRLVVGQYGAQMRLTENQHAVKELSAQGADEAFAGRVHARRLDSGAHDFGPGGLDDGVRGSPEVRSGVEEQELNVLEPLAEAECDLGATMLNDPDELLGGDPWARAHGLAERCGLDATAIWDWGVVERVTSGLRCTRINLQPLGLQVRRSRTAEPPCEQSCTRANYASGRWRSSRVPRIAGDATACLPLSTARRWAMRCARRGAAFDLLWRGWPPGVTA